MSLELTFHVIIQSDYHVGAGYGQGFGVDSALLREADNRLTLRGSMLAGLLRDGTYHLLKLPLFAYDEDNRKKRLQHVFGAPGRAKRWQIASAHPLTEQAALEDSQTAQRARIDPRSRRAEPRKLFSQEEGRAGQVFEFTMTCPQNDEAALDEAALLVAAARYVRQLGRSRRRGLGECLFTLVQVKGCDVQTACWQDWFLERFAQKWLTGTPALSKGEPQRAQVAAIPAPTGAAVRLRLLMRLDEPLLIARRAPAGNEFETQTFIPGSVVLGTLASLAAERCNLQDAAAYTDFVSLFRRGGVNAPVLYPAHEYSNYVYPAIPAPLGLLTCSVEPFDGKGNGHGLHIAKDAEQCPKCGARLEPVGNFMVLRAKTEKPVIAPQTLSELHIEINAVTGRVKRNQLYGYTALSAGQYFVGELLCADEAAWQRLQTLSGITEKQALIWRLGKARRRGYGKVTVWLERCDDDPLTWVQLPLEERVTNPQTLSLTLLTDTILQNVWGQQATGFVASWLETALGLGKIQITDAYARTRTVDTFNATLGLPRWRDTALLAGSVAYITLESPPNDWLERLRKLETEGIGLRRNEGFGRVAFNHPVYDRRGDLEYSEIELPDALQKESKNPNRTKEWAWEKTMRKSISSSLDERFIALARWLHAHNNQPPAELAEQIGHLGEPDTLLQETIGEYGARRKDNFFQTDGKRTAEFIRKALTDLQTAEQQYWSQGIDLLAEHILAQTEKSKGSEK